MRLPDHSWCSVYGITILQAYIYFRNGSKDSVYTRSFVSCVAVLPMPAIKTYYYFSIFPDHCCLKMHSLFLAHRVWALSKGNIPVVSSIVILALGSFAPSIVMSLYLTVISKSAKVSANFACTRRPRETRKGHANFLKNGLRNGSMACPKHPTPKKWERMPTHPIRCNPHEISLGLHRIGVVAAPDNLSSSMPTFIGRRGLFDLVSGGDLKEPARLKSGMERVYHMAVSWPRLLRGARQGSQLCRI
ncbi:hypothetical protein V8D89_007365 [Ganoderma adspersum]